MAPKIAEDRHPQKIAEDHREGQHIEVQTVDCDVLVVGAGVSGCALVSELVRKGLNVMLVSAPPTRSCAPLFIGSTLNYSPEAPRRTNAELTLACSVSTNPVNLCTGRKRERICCLLHRPPGSDPLVEGGIRVAVCQVRRLLVQAPPPPPHQ